MPENGLKMVGQRLKSWRARKGMKGSQLAESIHISRSSLSEIETGKSLPSAQTITRLMKLEGLDIFWLLTGEIRGDDEFLLGKEKVFKYLKKLTGKQEEVMELTRELESHLRQLIKSV